MAFVIIPQMASKIDLLWLIFFFNSCMQINNLNIKKLAFILHNSGFDVKIKKYKVIYQNILKYGKPQKN